MSATADDSVPTERISATLVDQYSEICTSHSNITDFRGKLLALFPIVGAGGLLIVIGKSYSESTDPTKIAESLAPVGAFALFITLGLFLYELRQIKECLALRLQAAAIEGRLGIPVGMAQFRDNPRLCVGVIGAELGSWVVYVTLIATWAYIALAPWLTPFVSILLGVLAIGVVFVEAVLIRGRDSRRRAKVRQALDTVRSNAQISPESTVRISVEDIASELHMDVVDVVAVLAGLAKSDEVKCEPGTNQWLLTKNGKTSDDRPAAARRSRLFREQSEMRSTNTIR